MKTLFIFAIGAMVFLSMAATPANKTNTPAKTQNKFFDGFSGIKSHRQGKGAVVSWSFQSSNVSGFIVQKTNENPNDPYSNWENVATVGSDASRSYKCSDDTPCFGIMNYHVVAVLNNGTTITSDITTLRIH
jgi:hypothetical protein